MQEYTVKHRRFVFEGNELLRFTSSLPDFAEYSQIGDFYAELSAKCERWCEEVKFPELCEQARLQREEGRGLPRRMVYSVRASIARLSEDTAEVCLEVLLSKSAKEGAPQFSDTQHWQLSTQSLMPLKERCR